MLLIEIPQQFVYSIQKKNKRRKGFNKKPRLVETYLVLRTSGTSPITSTHTPIDSVRASFIAGEAIDPAYTTDEALELANKEVHAIIRHHGGEENTQTAEMIRKTLLRQMIRLRELSTPYATDRRRERLAKIPELKADDLSTTRLNTMLRVISFFSGTGMPSDIRKISAPATKDIATPATSLLATLLLERGKIEHRVPPSPSEARHQRPSAA
jgi:hypothetical protein